MHRILFVCLGNICRSPAAEGVLLGVAEKMGFSHQIMVDSAGTGDWHIGSLADPRMRQAAARRGYDLKHKARQFHVRDFDRFDVIFTMDEHNFRNVLAMAPHVQAETKVRPFCTLLPYDLPRIPDPYYGNEKDFEHVLDLLEQGCEHLLESLHKLKNSPAGETQDKFR